MLQRFYFAATRRRCARVWMLVLLGISCALVACSGGESARTPATGVPPPTPEVPLTPPDEVPQPEPEPAESIDLRHWRLTIPADAKGGMAGAAEIISTQRLITAPVYQSQWFFAGSDGALHFWVPVDGAIGGTSPHPRSELREMLDPDNPALNWSSAAYSELLARCAVLQVPNVSRSVAVGQVHAYRSAGPLLLLRYYREADGKGKVVAIINPTPTATAPQRVRHTLVSGLPPGEAFDYRIAVQQGVLSVEVNGQGIRYPIGPAWAGAGHYFKAGAYILDEDGASDDGALVMFRRLVVAHH